MYRTYVEPFEGVVSEEDRLELAGRSLGEARANLVQEEPHHETFVTQFQQTTGPVMAKGVEDTALYRYLRLAALNEVDGNPARFSLGFDDFRRANLEREVRFPLQLLATQTDDRKRSGDLRARIVALSGLGDEWAERVFRWPRLDDPNESYLVYQTLVWTWPLELECLEADMEKALREAKRSTRWGEPNEEHERHVRAFCRALYADRAWRAEFEPFAAVVADQGRRVSLGMTLRN